MVEAVAFSAISHLSVCFTYLSALVGADDVGDVISKRRDIEVDSARRCLTFDLSMDIGHKNTIFCGEFVFVYVQGWW